MRKIYLFLSFIVLSLVLVACGDTVLSAPVVTLTEDQLSWDAVLNADHYLIFIDTDSRQTTETTYDLSQESLAAGTYTIYVVAATSTSVSVPSNSVSYVVAAGLDTTLGVPANLEISNAEILTWDDVTNATSYIVVVDGTEYPVTDNSFDLGELELAVGNYQVSVIAVNGSNRSTTSTVSTYTVAAPLSSDEVLAAVLFTMDSSYTLGMVASDFTYEYEYENYVNALEVATFYRDQALEAGMSTDDAAYFFGDMYQMTNGQIYSLSDLLSELQIFEDYDITANQVVEILYGLATMAVNMELDRLDQRLPDYLQDIVDTQDMYDNYLLSVQHTQAYNGFTAFTQSEQQVIVDKLFSGDSVSYMILDVMQWMAYDIQENGYLEPSYYYYSYGDEISDGEIDLIALIIENIYMTNLNYLNSLNSLWSEIDTQVTYKQQIRWAEQNYQNALDNIDRLEQLDDFLTLNEEQNKEALTSVVEFAFEVKNNVPENVVQLLDGQLNGTHNLTITEIFTIKDELISLLVTAIPEATEIKVFYDVAFAAGSAISGYDLSDFESYSTYLAEIDYLEITLALEFIGDFSVIDYTEISSYIGSLSDEYGYFNPINDPESLVGLLDFMVTYVEDFKDAHQTEVAALEAHFGDDLAEALYQQLLTTALNIATNELEDPMQLEIVTYVVTELSSDYSRLQEIITMYQTIGYDVLTEFINSEASLLVLINDLQMVDPNNETEVVAAIMDILAEINRYNAILSTNIGPEDVENMLAIAKIQAVVGLYLMNDLGLTLTEIDDLFDILYAYQSEVIALFIDLEAAFIAQIDQSDIENVIDIVLSGVDEYGYFDLANNPTLIVDMVTFIDSFITEFETNNPTLISELDILINGTGIETVYQAVIAFVENIFTDLNTSEPSDDYDAVLFALNQLSLHYDEVRSVIALVHTFGSDMVAHFISTEGSIINVIMDAQNVTTDLEATTVINQMIDEAYAYHDVAMSLLTDQQLTDLLTLVKIPLVINLYLNGETGYTLSELDTVFETLLPSIVDVILNIISLEESIASTISSLDAQTYYGDTGYTTDQKLAVELVFIDTLDQTLTLSNALLVTQTLNIVFTDILSNTDLQTILNLTLTDVEDLETNTFTFVTDFLDDIDTLAQLDFSNLNEQNLADIEMFMENYGFNAIFPLSFEEMLMQTQEVNTGTVYDLYFDEYMYYQFTATDTGTYTFLSLGSDDPFIEVYDSDFNYYDSADDENGWNFVLDLELQAGETIYLQLGYWGYSEGFSFMITYQAPTA